MSIQFSKLFQAFVVVLSMSLSNLLSKLGIVFGNEEIKILNRL